MRIRRPLMIIGLVVVIGALITACGASGGEGTPTLGTGTGTGTGTGSAFGTPGSGLSTGNGLTTTLGTPTTGLGTGTGTGTGTGALGTPTTGLGTGPVATPTTSLGTGTGALATPTTSLGTGTGTLGTPTTGLGSGTAMSATLTISPTVGGPGSEVTIVGSGFKGTGEVSLNWGLPGTGAILPALDAQSPDASGVVTWTYTLPAMMPPDFPSAGVSLIFLASQDNYKITASAPFTLTTSASGATR